MITEDQALRLLSEANPVPDASALEVNGAFPTSRLNENEARSSEAPDSMYDRPVTRPSPGQRRFVGIAAAIALLLVAGSFLLRTADESPVAGQPAQFVTEVKAQPAAGGLRSLPPADATPSTPENGELVASMWQHNSAPGASVDSWLYLYADGRMLWQRFPGSPSTLEERRLTPEGVELIRSELIETGLFDLGQPPPEDPGDGVEVLLPPQYIQVRNGDELVYRSHIAPELLDRLKSPWSWLPDHAWEDKEPNAYVPSRYAVCGTNEIGSVDLFGLPAGARDLLAHSTPLPLDALVALDPAGMGWAEGSTDECYDLATEEARELATTLDEAGLEVVRAEGMWSEVAYIVSGTLPELEDYPDPGNAVILTLWPLLPHGVPHIDGG